MGHGQLMGRTEEVICAVIQEKNLFSVTRAFLSHPRHDEVLMAGMELLPASQSMQEL